MGILIVVFLFAFYKRYKMIKAMTDMPDSEKLKTLNDNNFKSSVSKGISLVDFWAPWCTPCKIQGPIISELAEEMGDEVNICKLDVDQNKKVATELSIRSIPSILIFKDGEIVQQFVGMKTKNILKKALNSHLKL